MLQIEAFVKGFKLSTLSYKRVMHLLHQEMNNGLTKHIHPVADIKMFPTFVRSLPDGSGQCTWIRSVHPDHDDLMPVVNREG